MKPIRLRIVYEEELEALARLFFLTEGRNLELEDYQIQNSDRSKYFVLKANISLKLRNLLSRYELETIWAPIWVSGLARGFLSDQIMVASKLAKIFGNHSNTDLRWTDSYQQIVWVDRNDYMQIHSLLGNKNNDLWLFLEGADYERLVTGGVNNDKSIGDFYKPYPLTDNPEINKTLVESYLLGSDFFVLPLNISEETLRQAIKKNYLQTRSRRVPNGRKIQRFADLGYAVYLDSFDELKSLIYSLGTHYI